MSMRAVSIVLVAAATTASSLGFCTEIPYPTVLSGEANGDRFGVAVENAGDVNGDGYEDLLVGAQGSDIIGPDAGCAYLFLGGPDWDSTPDARFTPNPGSPDMRWFGSVLGRGGDFNGDGFADLFIGSPVEPGFNGAGRVYVYFGGSNLGETPAFILMPPDPLDGLASSLSWVGDINGDGFGDLVVGAPGYRRSPDSQAGRAYVYFGGREPDGPCETTKSGRESPFTSPTDATAFPKKSLAG